MPAQLKRLLKTVVTTIPLMNRIYLRKKVYTFDMDEKTIRGKIQQVGHRMDLYITSNKPVPHATLSEFDFLLGQILAKNVTIDGPMLWAFSLYVVAKKKLIKAYNGSVRQQMPESCPHEGNQLLDIILRRRSVRKWKSEEIALSELEKLIDIAKWAPSSCNRQLWKVLLINKEAEKQFLSKYFGNTFWHSAPVLAVILIDADIYGVKEKHYAYLDGAAFIQNYLLLLEMNGYGACWIGFAGWDTIGNIHKSMDDYEDFYRHFKFKKGLVPVSMIALGKPERSPRPPSRQGIDTIVIRGDST
jgi:nitroreductase